MSLCLTSLASAYRKISDLTGWGRQRKGGVWGQLLRAPALRKGEGTRPGWRDSVACDYMHWAEDRMQGCPTTSKNFVGIYIQVSQSSGRPGPCPRARCPRPGLTLYSLGPWLGKLFPCSGLSFFICSVGIIILSHPPGVVYCPSPHIILKTALWQWPHLPSEDTGLER